MRKYGYKYDGLNRLNASLYIKPKNSLQRGIDLGSYNENITYDKNGNINTLFRNGDLDSNLDVIEIDDLDYVYDGGNKLLKVMDNSNHPEGFKDGTNSGNDYSYDDFGNMIQDLNKEIAQITYNHLNLPKKITYSTSSQNISYLYNALGVKVQKKVFKSGIVGTFNPDHTVTTDYLSGFHYEFNDNPNIASSGGLKFFETSEGYVNITTGKLGNPSYNYVYNYTDHLGNVRVSYTNGTGGAATILEENHYYPFGLKHKKYGSTVKNFVEIEDGDGYYVGVETVPPGARKTYQYKYNGKEFQDELNLNVYDYGARFYMPDIGRWNRIDNKAEYGYMLSPYQYSFNNPVMFIDKDGNWSVSVHYNITSEALRKAGYNDYVVRWVSHYSSVYADHPPKHFMYLNNATNKTSVAYSKDVDYSLTRNSQQTDYDPQRSTSYNYNIWHSMRSNQEAVLFGQKKFGGISRKDAMLRGLEFGWSKIFESAKSGKMSDFKINSKGIQALGQGLHALQDAWAHMGVSMNEHDAFNDAFNTSGKRKDAEALTESAINVHKLLSGDWEGLGDSFNLFWFNSSKLCFDNFVTLLCERLYS